MTLRLLDGERDRLAAVVSDLRDDGLKLAYAEWLESRGDGVRARFLRDFVRASRSMEAGGFPPADGLPEEWLELVGFRLLERLADEGVPDLKESVLRLARPALRMRKGPTATPPVTAGDGRPGLIGRLLRLGRPAPAAKTSGAANEIPVGASKVGGLPDLPPGFRWPRGGDCRAIYNDDTAGAEGPAGFLAQVNLAEITETQAARDLPRAGVLSFFSYLDDDDPDVIGAAAFYFPDASVLARAEPPEEPTESNGVIPPRRLAFEETLDLPEYASGPWSGEITPDPEVGCEALDHFLLLNFENLLGYGRATTGDDPTPSRRSRHLVLLQNAVGYWLHLQIGQDDLAARAFDRITLSWVDFDEGDVPAHVGA